MTLTSHAQRALDLQGSDRVIDLVEDIDCLPATFRELMPNTSIRLVIMLYDGAIAALNMAQKSLEEGNEKSCGEAVRMVNDIVAQLYLALDFDSGGEVAGNLGRIYSYILSRTQQHAPRPDAALIREVHRMLNQLHQSWREIDLKMSSAEAARGAAA